MRLSNDITARATRFPHIPCDKAKLAQTWNLAKSESRFSIVKFIKQRKSSKNKKTHKCGGKEAFKKRERKYEI